MPATKIRPEKQETVKKIKEKVDSAKVIVLTDYKGMSVKQITELRRKLDKDKAEYKVLKNTMVSLSLPEGMADLKGSLNGPMAVLFGYEDVILPLKTLAQFASDEEKPKILMGVVEGQICANEKILELSKLPSREELIAKMVSQFKSPLYGLVNVLAGNLRKVLYALNAIKDKKSQGGEQ